MLREVRMRFLPRRFDLSESDRQIAFYIICAQAAYDGVESVTDLIDASPFSGRRQSELESAYAGGYNYGALCIARAIELIDSYPSPYIYYSFSNDNDGYKVVVHFKFRLFKTDGTASHKDVMFLTSINSLDGWMKKPFYTIKGNHRAIDVFEYRSSSDDVLELLKYVIW